MFLHHSPLPVLPPNPPMYPPCSLLNLYPSYLIIVAYICMYIYYMCIYIHKCTNTTCLVCIMLLVYHLKVSITFLIFCPWKVGARVSSSRIWVGLVDVPVNRTWQMWCRAVTRAKSSKPPACALGHLFWKTLSLHKSPDHPAEAVGSDTVVQPAVRSVKCQPSVWAMAGSQATWVLTWSWYLWWHLTATLWEAPIQNCRAKPNPDSWLTKLLVKYNIC